MTAHWEPDEALAAFADLDLDRAARRGYPEAVYCRGKTVEQVRLIAGALRGHGACTSYTRASPEHAAAILGELPGAFTTQTAGCWRGRPTHPTDGRTGPRRGRRQAGLAPLLTMLNSCAPRVTVVNIDNGYGAGHLAAQIAAPS